MQKLSFKDRRRVHHATQRANIVEKFHKPPHGFNVINFELNGFNAFIDPPVVPRTQRMYW